MTRVESVVTDGVTDQDIERQWQKLQRIKPAQLDAFHIKELTLYL